MSAADYIATFASIVVGLAFADLLTSFHRLVRARRTIRWDWLPVASALLVLLTIVQAWWRFFDIWTTRSAFNFGQFLPDLFSLILLFLLAAAALPDDGRGAGKDLRRYYMVNRTYFWGLYSGYVLVVTLNRIGRTTGFQEALPVLTRMNLMNLVSVTLMIVLMFTARRLVHSVVVVLFLVQLTIVWIRLTISG